MFESAIQSKIIKHLSNEGWIVVKLIQTNMNGIPDLMVLKGGRTLFIEVKSETGKLSDLQGHRIEQLHKQGFDAVVVRSLDEVKKILAVVLTKAN